MAMVKGKDVSDVGVLFFIVVFSFIAIILFVGAKYDITTGAIVVDDTVTKENAEKIAENYVGGLIAEQMTERFGEDWQDYYSVGVRESYKEKHIWYVKVGVVSKFVPKSSGDTITVKVSARTGSVI